MKSMLHIGHDAETIKEAIPVVTKAIMEILMSPAGDDVKKKAMDVIGMNIEVKNVSVSNCSFTTSEEK